MQSDAILKGMLKQKRKTTGSKPGHATLQGSPKHTAGKSGGLRQARIAEGLNYRSVLISRKSSQPADNNNAIQSQKTLLNQ